MNYHYSDAQKADLDFMRFEYTVKLREIQDIWRCSRVLHMNEHLR